MSTPSHKILRMRTLRFRRLFFRHVMPLRAERLKARWVRIRRSLSTSPQFQATLISSLRNYRHETCAFLCELRMRLPLCTNPMCCAYPHTGSLKVQAMFPAGSQIPEQRREPSPASRCYRIGKYKLRISSESQQILWRRNAMFPCSSSSSLWEPPQMSKK